MEIQLHDIRVEVERKWIRTMRLTVRPPDGRVRLSVPWLVSSATARAFLESKWEWICRSRERVMQRVVVAEKNYADGETHYLFGTPYTLRVIALTNGRSRTEIADEELRIYCREDATREQRERLLRQLYREQLTAELTEQIGHWLERIGEGEISWRLRLMRSEWGSCNARKRRLVFNEALARVPKECIEYIVVHELSHLAVQNHGPAFKALMSERLPDWPERRKKLKVFT